jgi:hypothetical protein
MDQATGACAGRLARPFPSIVRSKSILDGWCRLNAFATKIGSNHPYPLNLPKSGMAIESRSCSEGRTRRILIEMLLASHELRDQAQANELARRGGSRRADSWRVELGVATREKNVGVSGGSFFSASGRRNSSVASLSPRICDASPGAIFVMRHHLKNYVASPHAKA